MTGPNVSSAKQVMSGRDALEDGRLVEVRAEVGPRLAAGQHPGALRDGVVHVAYDGVELLLGDQRAHVVAPVERRAEGHRLGALHEPLDEPVVDLVGDEHPLHRDAELAGVGEARPHRAFRRLVEVGVAQDQDRVLAAELQRAADQPLRAALGDQLAGGRRAGEADVVRAADDLRPEVRAGAGDDLPEVLREAGLLEQLRAEQRATAWSARPAWRRPRCRRAAPGCRRRAPS